jgi:hypothetical protein
VLTSNGTTWTSAAAAPSAGVLQAVATGSLSDGTKVIINADGTVSAVTQTAGPAIADSNNIFSGTNAVSYQIACAYDVANQKVIIVYAPYVSFNYTGWAVVGTVSGSTITFGTPAQFTSSSYTTFSECPPGICIDSASGNFVIVFKDVGNSGYPTAIVGSVSGTSITFGAKVVIQSNNSDVQACVYDPVQAKSVVFFNDIAVSPNRPAARVGTVSGTSITFGTKTSFASGYAASLNKPTIVYDAASSKIICFAQGINNNGVGSVCTVSGTSISIGTHSVFCTGTTSSFGFNAVYYGSQNKTLIVYGDTSNSNFITGRVATVSGTSISYGSVATITSKISSNQCPLSFDSTNNISLLLFYDSANSFAKRMVQVSVSGSTVSFANLTAASNDYSFYQSSCFHSASNKVVIPNLEASTNYGGAATISAASFTTNLTAENFIGISNAAYANGATATIQTVGSVDDAQSGLTAGQAYYVQGNGTLSTTPDSPSVFAGTAVSATKLIVKG